MLSSQRLLRIVVAWLLSLPAFAVRAEGGEAYQELGDSGGQLRPMQESVIRLVREDLTLKLLDQEHYAIEANDVLSNPGPEKDLEFGVPIDISLMSFRPGANGEGRIVERSKAEVARRAREMASSIRVSLGGTARSCKYVDGRCVLTLRVPSGEKIPLQFTFTSGVKHTFVHSGDAKRNEWSPSRGHYAAWGWERVLLFDYALAPAGTWAGTPERLTISISADRDQFDAVRLTTAEIPDIEFHREGDLWWVDLQDQGLRSQGSLDVALAARVHGPKSAPLVARASSSIPANGKISYGPENALDSRYTTAWCVNTPSHGVGEWIELDFSQEHFTGDVHAVDGYAKSEKAFRANGRIKRLAVSACGGGPALAELHLGRKEYGDSMWEHDRVEGADRLVGCARFQILEVEPGGSSDDVCLTELRLDVRY